MKDELTILRRRFGGHEPGLLGARAEYAVLCPLIDRPDGLHLLFEVRAAALRQGGEVCFPGGRREAGDLPTAPFGRRRRNCPSLPERSSCGQRRLHLQSEGLPAAAHPRPGIPGRLRSYASLSGGGRRDVHSPRCRSSAPHRRRSTVMHWYRRSRRTSPTRRWAFRRRIPGATGRRRSPSGTGRAIPSGA